MGDIHHSVCDRWMRSTWEMLKFSKAFRCCRSLGSEWRSLLAVWQVSHLSQTWYELCPLVESKDSSNEVVDADTFTHENWVAKSVNRKTLSATVTVISIESEAPVLLKTNLTGKHCVYTDSCVYRVIVLGCCRSHWVYICVHMYIFEVLRWIIPKRRVAEDYNTVWSRNTTLCDGEIGTSQCDLYTYNNEEDDDDCFYYFQK